MAVAQIFLMTFQRLSSLVVGLLLAVLFIAIGSTSAHATGHIAVPSATKEAPPRIMATAAAQADLHPSGSSPTVVSGAKVQQQPATSVLPATASTSPLSSASTSPLQREVFGFVNAGNLGDPNVGYPSWNFSLLSTVAYFGLHVKSGDGSVDTSDTGWLVLHSSTWSSFLSTAHAHGVRAIISLNVHDFSADPNNQTCGALAPANAQTTINIAVQLLAQTGADGINIDYEGTNTTCADGSASRDEMTAFTKNLRAAMPNNYIAIDTYSGSAEDNLEFFDIAGLGPYVDSFFVMAYDMDYANYSSPPVNCSSYCFNPISPLSGYAFNDTSSMAQYTALVPASKVILGQPYYGRRGCVNSLTAAYQAPIPNTNFVTPTYQFASTIPSQSGVSNFTAHRDPADGVSEWDTWYDTDFKCNREQYFDDTVSLAAKYDLVNRDGLRGVGFFTLDYAGGASELWQEIAIKFTPYWSSLGGSIVSSPHSVSWGPNRIDAFAVGTDNALWHRAWDGTQWLPWNTLHGVLTSDPIVVSPTSGRIDVFARGSDRALWHIDWNQTAWSSWESLGGIIVGPPSVVSSSSTQMDVVALGSDNAVWHRSWNGTTWAPWDKVGGVGTSNPSVVSWGAGRLDVFVRGSDYALWHRAWISGTWQPWESLGGYIASNPAPVTWGTNRLDVFVRGGDGHLWHRAWDGTKWWPWESLGGYVASQLAVTSWGPGRLDIFAVGGDSQLWHRWWNGTAWGGWQSLQGQWTANPSASVRSVGIVNLFERGGPTNALWQASMVTS